MGRPIKPDKDKKSAVTALRFKEDERSKLERAANSKGQKLTEWMRETLVDSANAQLQQS